MQVEVLHNQSLLDVALQNSGLLDIISAVAVLNGISVSDELTAGAILEIPADADADILQYFSVKQITPATSMTAEDQTKIRYNEGIDFWEIGENFEVQ